VLVKGKSGGYKASKIIGAITAVTYITSGL
jgi:hypothetical protein